jgi:hypothetical protein
VWRDVSDDRLHTSTFVLDDEGHFLVGAAVGCGSAAELARARALVDGGARVLVMYVNNVYRRVCVMVVNIRVCSDSSHGACEDARSMLHLLKRECGSTVQVRIRMIIQ